MGVDLETLLSHKLDSSGVQALPRTLNADRPLARAVAALRSLNESRYRRRQEDPVWRRVGSEHII